MMEFMGEYFFEIIILIWSWLKWKGFFPLFVIVMHILMQNIKQINKGIKISILSLNVKIYYEIFRWNISNNL